MEAFLFISLFLFAVIGIGLWVAKTSRLSQVQLPSNNLSATLTAVPPGRALFANEESLAAFVAEETIRANAEARAALMTRAQNGDVSTLDETFADASLYGETLNALTAHAQAKPDGTALQVLTRHVLQHGEWRATPALALAMLARWQAEPSSSSLGETLHVAALSDDAAVFQQAVETALQSWRAGQLAWASPGNLKALIESEYWILSPEARNSGAGFLLKRMLVAARRELAAVAQPVPSNTNQ